MDAESRTVYLFSPSFFLCCKGWFAKRVVRFAAARRTTLTCWLGKKLQDKEQRYRAVQSCPSLCSVDFLMILASQVTQHMPLTNLDFLVFATTLRCLPFNFQRFGTLNLIRHVQTFCFSSSSPKWFNGAWPFHGQLSRCWFWHIVYFVEAAGLLDDIG